MGHPVYGRINGTTEGNFYNLHLYILIHTLSSLHFFSLFINEENTGGSDPAHGPDESKLAKLADSLSLSINEENTGGSDPAHGLDESTLATLADSIETDEQFHALGRELGFNQAKLYRYDATNRLEGRKTTKGTLEMLVKWRDSTDPRCARSLLKDALREAHQKQTSTSLETYTKGK